MKRPLSTWPFHLPVQSFVAGKTMYIVKKSNDAIRAVVDLKDKNWEGLAVTAVTEGLGIRENDLLRVLRMREA